MTVLENLLGGFAVALSPVNLIAALAGAVLGTLVGVLPGIGPIASMSLLIPLTFAMDPTTAIIMLAGIYYGAMYGGSTTAILINVPGESTSVITAIDGYQLARQGRAGTALAVGSYVAGTISVAGLMLLAPVLALAALEFGPPEYFALIVFGFVVLSRLARGSPLKALLMGLLGLMLSTVGMEPVTGYQRYVFGTLHLLGGVDFVPVVMGLFGVAEILWLASAAVPPAPVRHVRFAELWPRAEEWRRSVAPWLRGGVIGFLIGIVPGPAAILAPLASYAVEKRLARRPEEFGRGAIEGVAGPEAANNAATGGAFVPLLALGIPFAPATAVLLGALMIHGIRPGPLLMQQRPELFWGVVASMYLGNLMLLVLNLPLVGVFASALRIPRPYLLSSVLVLTIVGAYSVNNAFADVWILLAFGVVGYLMRLFDFDPAPLVLALVLGPMLETSFRQSLIMARGDAFIFVERPLSAAFLALAALLLIGQLVAAWRARGAAEAKSS